MKKKKKTHSSGVAGWWKTTQALSYDGFEGLHKLYKPLRANSHKTENITVGKKYICGLWDTISVHRSVCSFWLVLCLCLIACQRCLATTVLRKVFPVASDCTDTIGKELNWAGLLHHWIINFLESTVFYCPLALSTHLFLV